MSDEHFAVRQEADVVAARRLATIAVVGTLIAMLTVVLAGWVVAAGAGGLVPDAAGPGGTRPAPRAIAGVEQSLFRGAHVGADLREGQLRKLEGWGWVDRDAGVAHIPIDRAIDVVVERGVR